MVCSWTCPGCCPTPRPSCRFHLEMERSQSEVVLSLTFVFIFRLSAVSTVTGALYRDPWCEPSPAHSPRVSFCSYVILPLPAALPQADLRGAGVSLLTPAGPPWAFGFALASRAGGIVLWGCDSSAELFRPTGMGCLCPVMWWVAES